MPEISKLVLEIVLEIARIPEVGAEVLLRAFSMRKKIIVNPDPRLFPLHREMAAASTPLHRLLVMRIINAVLENTALLERAPLRNEILAMHPVAPKAFLELIDSFSASDAELSAELDTFIGLLREDSQKIKTQVEETTEEQSTMVEAALRIQERGEEGRVKKQLEKHRGNSKAGAQVELQLVAAGHVDVGKSSRALRGLHVDLSLTGRELVELAVKQFAVKQDAEYGLWEYGLCFETDGPDKAMVWIEEANSLLDYEGLVSASHELSKSLTLAVKPTPMSVRLPSGETRTFSLTLTTTVAEVLEDLARQVMLPLEHLSLAKDAITTVLAAGESLAAQGVEPYTVLLLLNKEDDKPAQPTPAAAPEGKARGLKDLTISKATKPAAADPEPPDNSPLANIWEEPHSVKYIIVENGEVTSATLNKMIERMTSIDTIDLQLTQTFLITYKSFTSADEMWLKLMERYDAPPRVSEVDRQKVRVRMCMFLKKWLEGRRAGDVGPELLMKMVDFIEKRLPKDGLSDMQQVLTRMVSGGQHEKVIQYDRRQAPKVKHPKVKTVEKMTVMDIDPTELARQITLKTWEIFCMIQPPEFFDQAWMKADAAKKSPNILALIEFFNHFSNGVATAMVSEPRLRKRIAVAERWIDVGTEIRKLNNFHMVMALISTFAQACINRLKYTLEKVSDNHKLRLKELQTLMDPTRSFQSYRQAYKECGLGIPYLGVSLTVSMRV